MENLNSFEVWKDAVGYDGKYSVSSFGRVRSNFATRRNGNRRETGNMLKGRVSTRGYEKVGIYFNGVGKSVSVHRLVCTAFHPNPENKPQVNHKDLNPLNNHECNLEWNTARENTLHAQANGRIPTAKPYVKKGVPDGRKAIINIETKEIVQSVKRLSEITNVPVKKWRRALCGERVNTSNFRYVGQEDVAKQPIERERPKSRIALFSLDGVFKRSFDYKKDCCLYLKTDRSSLNDFLNGKQSQIKGHKVKMMADDGSYIEPLIFVSKKPPLKPKKEKGIVTQGKPLFKKSISGEIIESFHSIYSAAKSMGVDKRVFRKAIKKSPRNYYKGFIWEHS